MAPKRVVMMVKVKQMHLLFHNVVNNNNARATQVEGPITRCHVI